MNIIPSYVPNYSCWYVFLQVHMPSLTVFSNFPDQSDVLRVPYRLDFSVNSGYFGIGNNKGRVLLYRYVINMLELILYTLV